MAPLKRKRTHEAATTSSQPRKTTAILPPVPITSPSIPRRATRSIPLSGPELELPPRRRRRGANGPIPMASSVGSTRPLEPPRGKENIPIGAPQNPLKHARRDSGHSATAIPPPNIGIGSRRASHTFTPVPIPIIPPQADRAARLPSRDTNKITVVGNGRPSGRLSAATMVLPPHQHTVGRSKPITIATSGAQPRQSPTPTAPGPPRVPEQNGQANGGDRHYRQESDRNIDKVVLGDICFRAWYPSYYGKEVLGEGAGSHGSSKGGMDCKGGSSGSVVTNGVGGGSRDDGNGTNVHGRRDRDNTPILERLYVCPCCFKYSKELVAWWEHVRECERRGYMPGKKIYVHPKGRRKVLVATPAPPPKAARGKRASGQKVIEEVRDQGEWSILEVDGAKDVLFCQNLSLFAKLFLDNKSVFFDVTGFNYFLLAYTPPAPPTSPDVEVVETTPARSQVVGFFSKEKMSWDNNNLACILIFPPWQRKGLGALLMGISYEISRREGVMGGPEKPISDLGKKGYKRFWAGEIARWILGLNIKEGEEETVVDVNECSTATWIAPEDCLVVLRDMGVAVDAGKGPPRVRKPIVGEENGAHSVLPATGTTPEVEAVQRVKISKQAVRAWVAKNRISLQRKCDPEGFVEGYAIKSEEEEEEAAS